ncbi:helix-turn-helix domain-containing protein [Xylanibacter rarus]|uniref:helix-turn-helix domain-containing protein n=2 Tax=Prevotellaceae TaxID=171552 RepID=UPI003FD85DF4
MHSYYDSERQLTDGLPTVQACASELCLSSNYFADLIKKQTGITAGEHIHRFVMSMAKSRLTAGEQVCQVAYALGFEYPQHFSRLFKKMEGCTPSEYIASRNRRPDHRADNGDTGATAG